MVVGEPEPPLREPTDQECTTTLERNILLMFGSHKEAEMSAFFYTFIGTCKINQRSLSEKLGLTQSVIFEGRTNSAVETLKNGLLLLSSDYEGIPNVIIKTIITSVPVVSIDCHPGGIRVLIEDGGNGFIVPIRDYGDLECMACKMLNNPSHSGSFVKKSKERLQLFGVNIIFEK